MLDVLRRSDAPIAEEIGSGTYRLLFRVLASHPEEVTAFYDDTVAPLVRYDDQYRTDLVGTLESYFDNDCNMNATAANVFAHRHTVAYRLERVKELHGARPAESRRPRTPRAGAQGLPHHRPEVAALRSLGEPVRAPATVRNYRYGLSGVPFALSLPADGLELTATVKQPLGGVGPFAAAGVSGDLQGVSGPPLRSCARALPLRPASIT